MAHSEVRGNSFAEQLRNARRAASLTQEEVAARANVSRRTLIRWEMGKVSPFMPELISVIEALGCCDEGRSRLISSLESPRAMVKAASLPSHQLTPMEKACLIGGRAGLNSQGLSDAMGIHTSTLSRWKARGVGPSKDGLTRLIAKLDISDVERSAAETWGTGNRQGPQGYWLTFDFEAATRLKALQSASPTDPQVVTETTAVRARFARDLADCGRWIEAIEQAEAVIQLERTGTPVQKEVLALAHSVAARFHFRASWRNAQRGLVSLAHLSGAAYSFETLALRLSLLSECYARHQRLRKAIRYGRQSVEMASRGKGRTLTARKLDFSKSLLRLGKLEEALDVCPDFTEESPELTVEQALHLSSLLGALGRQRESDHWQKIAAKAIVQYNLQARFRLLFPHSVAEMKAELPGKDTRA